MDVVVNVVPNILNLSLQLISTFILFLIIKKFFWKNTREFIAKRQEIVASEIIEAKRQNEEAVKYLSSAKEELKLAREKAAEIVNDSKKAANTVHESIIINAQKEVEYLKQNAKDSIVLEQTKFYDTLKDELVDLAIVAASKIIEEEIDESKHTVIVNSFIEGVQ